MHPESGKGLHIVVIANGELSQPTRLARIVAQADKVVAADGGANWLVSQGRTPDVLIGDMDSIAPQVLRALEARHCQLLRHARDKDETDTELALMHAAKLGARRITLLGALGGRADHALANVLLLAIPQLAGIEATIFDGTSYLWILRKQGRVRGEVGDTVSLLPLQGDAEGIVTEGFRYPLQHETLRFGLARGVSNVLLDPVGEITLQRGMLLIVHTPAYRLEE
jgi:thiamine pyrophosphokinase